MSLFFCFKQKTPYDMRISDWSSDVCSSDLFTGRTAGEGRGARHQHIGAGGDGERRGLGGDAAVDLEIDRPVAAGGGADLIDHGAQGGDLVERSEEITSELPSLMRISYVVFCL